MQPGQWILRPAVESDSPAIRKLIRQVNINPTELSWQRFIVAMDGDDRLIGCGQVKTHQGGVRELASIAVVPERRGEGIARKVIEHLIALHPSPLYLTCRRELGAFYQRFGFSTLGFQEMPVYYRRLFRIAHLLHTTGIISGEMLVMGRAIENAASAD